MRDLILQLSKSSIYSTKPYLWRNCPPLSTVLVFLCFIFQP
jgi:hypothetical protein